MEPAQPNIVPDRATVSLGLARSEAPPPPVAALLQPAAYPHPADDLHLHETHVSWVVLAGPYAYEVKKPADLGFLDFSTPERRAAACADAAGGAGRGRRQDTTAPPADVVSRALAALRA